MNIKTTNKRIISIIILTGLFMVLIFSSFFILHETDHACIEDACSTCVAISAVARLLKQLSLGITSFSGVASISLIIIATLITMLSVLTVLTPITKKTRMNH